MSHHQPLYRTFRINFYYDFYKRAIEQLGGLELEAEYPYSAKGGQCHFNKTMSHVQVTGAVDLPKNETAMVQWLVANGPLSIGNHQYTNVSKYLSNRTIMLF